MPLDTIAIDLTPVLPGGENGGAKVFTLALVRELAARAPGTRFILLTQSASHEELAALDAPNVERRLVMSPSASALRPRLLAWASRVLAPFPAAIRRAATRAGYAAHVFLKRGGADGLLHRERVDLLFCPFTSPAFREEGIPVVCTLYDLQHRVHPEFFSVEDAVQRDLAFVEACRNATRLAAISEFTRAAVVDQEGVDPRSIRAIALRLADFAEDAVAPGAVLARLGLEERGYVLYPANFWRHKNHEALIAAFAIARSRGLPEPMKLVFTGAPGPRSEALERLARRGGLGDRVVFAGYLAHQELMGLMVASKGVVFPSLYEGFGLAVVEAMACDVPVACSRAGALPEVAGDAALYFDPTRPEAIAEALVALATDAALATRLVTAGRVRSAQFSDRRRMAADYWQLFEEAAAAMPRGPA